MSSDTFSPVSARRRRTPWPSSEPADKTVPFVPAKPQRQKPQPQRGRRAAEKRAAVPRRRRREVPAHAVRPKPPRVRRRLRPGGLYRWVRRFRIPVALVLGLCAAAAAMLAAESSQVETTTAVRVTSSVAAGEVLTAELLEEAEVDVEAVPAEHIGEIDECAGRTAATALPAGALVHPSQMVGPGLLQGHGAETVAVPVRPSDASMIGLLSPGQHVDVTASSDAPESAGGTQRIAESAPVLWVPQGESENWLGAAEQASRVVILAVDSETASAIAEASHQGRLHLSLVSEPQA